MGAASCSALAQATVLGLLLPLKAGWSRLPVCWDT